ncbi:MAG: 50S ribosomal protein L18 [Phycisphaeraceae bacterium]|nr:50S ribosomal protein L18 [Phycisphaeraceae bacterium]
MQANVLKQVRRQRRKTGIRKRIIGTAERPRLTVYRSLNHIYAQIIDDVISKTLASASSVQEKLEKGGGNAEAAKRVGKALAERAKAAGVTQVAMDRNGFKYHGRIKALADAAREAGLKF